MQPHLEQSELAQVPPSLHSVREGRCQAGHVPKAQVDALPGQRVHCMGCITDKSQPRPHIPAARQPSDDLRMGPAASSLGQSAPAGLYEGQGEGACRAEALADQGWLHEVGMRLPAQPGVARRRAALLQRLRAARGGLSKAVRQECSSCC